MFNPFSIGVLQPVMDKIQKSVNETPREIKIVYFYHKNKECQEYMDSISWLSKVQVKDLPCGIYSNSLQPVE